MKQYSYGHAYGCGYGHIKFVKCKIRKWAIYMHKKGSDLILQS